MSRSKYLPAPLRSGSERAIQPDVIVIEPGMTRRPANRNAAPLAKLALDLAPDLLRAFERSRSQRADGMNIPARQTRRDSDRRTLTSGIRLSEVELDIRIPFVRRVTVRRATAWMTELPLVPTVETPRRTGKFVRAGIVSIGGAVALAAVSLVARARD